MKMTGSKFIDSSVWLEYLLKGSFRDMIEGDEIFFLSAMSLFEIKKKLVKASPPSDIIINSMKFIKKKSFIVSIDSEIAEYAAEISILHNLGAVDALIYASALKNNVELITLDNDFRGLKEAIILD